MARSSLSALRKEKNTNQSMSPTTRACDACRQKKIRCDVVEGSCAQCIKSQSPCHFSPVSTKRAPRRLNRDKRVEELERRLKSMEKMLKSRGSNSQPTSNDLDFGENSGRLDSHSSNQSELSFPNSASCSDMASTVSSEKTRAWSLPSSGDSASSPEEGLPTIPNSKNTMAQGPTMGTLPPKDTLLKLVKESFQGFYSAYPLFDKTRFMSVCETLGTCIDDPGQWACLNVVLALTFQFEYETAEELQELYDPDEYFRTAFALCGPLMTMHVTLWSIQALLGMALVIQGSPTQGPTSLLISAAMKLAHTMGLHRRCQNPDIGAAEVEERRRVFWIAYSLDKDLSLQMGQPSAQDDDDMDVELPSDEDSTPPDAEQETGSCALRFRAKLAMIQGRIYERLYSVKASKQAEADRVLAATELEAMLQSWRASVPSKLVEGFQGHLSEIPTSETNPYPVILHLVYFNSLAMVYDALPALPRYRELPAPCKPAELQLLAAPLVYAAEARKAIRLLQFTPPRGYACIWAVLYIFVRAATRLLRDIIDDPSAPTARPDLQLIEPLIVLLDALAQSPKGRQSERLGDMYRPCKELYGKAVSAVNRIDHAGIDWDQWITCGQSQEWADGGEFDCNGVSGDFAFAVEQQFQESTAV